MDRYQAFIEESVAGLNVDAPVKYLGVDVGKVSRIGIDPQNSRRVRLVFLINRGTPIKQDSVAVLKAQGLTGIAHVELSGGSEGSRPLVAGADGVPPTIPFKLSLGARLENVITNVLGNIDRVSDNLNAVFNAENQLALKSTLADMAALAHALEAQKGVLTRAIDDAARTTQLTAKAGERLDPALLSITRSAQSVDRMADGVSATSLRATRAADSAASAVQQASSETLPELARLMAELNQLSASLRTLSEQTARSPSSLVVGRPLPQPGPGESTPP
jgi:phospholipid/cholesterol/gamma-HCH transport system substrate-binding protein